MPETGGRTKKHLQHSCPLLRKGVVVTSRGKGAGFAPRSGEKGAPLTPLPTWKLYENPSYQNHAVATVGRPAASVTGSMDGEDSEDVERNEEEEEMRMWAPESGIKSVGREDNVPHIPYISARKLAASLWEELQVDEQEEGIPTLCDISELSPRSHFQRKASSFSTSESPDSVNHQHFSKAPTKRQEFSRKAQLPTTLSPPLKAIMLVEPGAAGVTSRFQGSVSKASNFRGKDAREERVELSNTYEGSDITSPCNYIEAPCRSQALERTPQMDTSESLELPFSEELKRALSKVQQVEAAQISARKEVDSLLRRCADEILILQTREQEKIQAAVLLTAEQLEKERKVKRKVEAENRRLASSLADANKAVLAAKEELEKERKARQLIEDVCDELAKEIGEDKSEAEELKRELGKIRKEIEEERKTFQVTEAWREERVQMKLSEARLELEERCMALDNLKMELELFLEEGRVHRVEASLDGKGEVLRGMVKRLEEDTSESVFFRKDVRGLLSPGSNEAMLLDKSRSRKNSWSSNENGSIMHVNMYDKDGIHQILQLSEISQNTCGWNVESDRLSKEHYNGLVSTKAHLNEHGRHWISCMRASGHKAGMKSYGSKARGLDNLDGQGFTGDSYDGLDDRSRASSADSGVGGDQSSECGSSSEGEQDFECVNGHLRLRNVGLLSASEADQESQRNFLPKSGTRKVANRSVEKANVKRRQGRGRGKEQPGENGRKKRVERFNNAQSHGKYVCSQTEYHGNNGFLSLTGYSPAYRGHLPSPDLVAQQGANQTQKGKDWTQKGSNRSKRRALLGMKAIYNTVDWSKPYKRNSLQAKLLLEDGLSGGDFKLMHY